MYSLCTFLYNKTVFVCLPHVTDFTRILCYCVLFHLRSTANTSPHRHYISIVNRPYLHLQFSVKGIPFPFKGFSPTPFAIVPYFCCCKYSRFPLLFCSYNPTWEWSLSVSPRLIPTVHWSTLGDFVTDYPIHTLLNRHNMISLLLWCMALRTFQ